MQSRGIIEQPVSDLAIWSVILPHLTPEGVFLLSRVNRYFRNECDQAKYWDRLARDYFITIFHARERQFRLRRPAKTWKQEYALWYRDFRWRSPIVNKAKYLDGLVKEGDVAGLEAMKLERSDFDLIDSMIASGRSQAMCDYAFKLFWSLFGNDKGTIDNSLFVATMFNQADFKKKLFESTNFDAFILCNEKLMESWINALLSVGRGGHVLAVDALLSFAASANDPQLDFAKMVALYEAIRYGRVEVVKQLIAFGVPVDGLRNLSDELVAFLEQPQEINKCLSDALKNCNVGTGCVRDIVRLQYFIPSPLIMATNLGDIDIMKVLLGQGANPNLIDEQPLYDLDPLIQFKKTALHFAIAENDIHAVQVLLDHGARVDKYDEVERSSLLFAMERKNKPIINLILKKLVNTNLSSYSPEPLLALAVNLNDDSIIRAMLSMQVNLNDPLRRPFLMGGGMLTLEAPLSLAAEDNNIALFLALLNHGANMGGDLKDNIAYYKESHTFFKSLIQILIVHGYNAAILNHMLTVVVVIGDEELASRVVAALMKGGHLDTKPLTQAIIKGESFWTLRRASIIVELFIDTLCQCREVDVDSLNGALYVSAKRGNLGLVRRLICCGANPNYALYHSGLGSVISIARENGHTAIIELLINATNEKLLKYINERTKKPYAAILRIFSYATPEDKELTAAKLLLAFRKGEVNADELEPYKAELKQDGLWDIYRCSIGEQDSKQTERQETCRRSNGF